MNRVLSVLALSSMSLLAVAAGPAAAVQVMVAVNASPQDGLDPTATKSRLKELMKTLFKYDNVNMAGVIDSSQERFYQHLRVFKAKSAGTDYAIFYFLGLGAHNQSTNYLVPYGWTGNEAELIQLEHIVASMRHAAPGRSLIILDIADAKSWPAGSIRAGLGRIEPEAKGGGVLIIYNHTATLSAKGGTIFTDSLEKEVSKPVSLMQLASLVQADVRFESNGVIVPRVTGATKTLVSLSRLPEDQIEQKSQNTCLTYNERVDEKAKTQVATAGKTGTQADGDGNVVRLSANKGQMLSNSVSADEPDNFFDDFLPHLCPLLQRPPAVRQKPGAESSFRAKTAHQHAVPEYQAPAHAHAGNPPAGVREALPPN